MPDVVITEFMDENAVTELREGFDTLYDESLFDDRHRLTGAIEEARALVVRNRTIVDRHLLDHAPRLLIVARLGVGLDNIDVGACRDREIEVAPAIGANAISVAEYVVGAALTLIRGSFDLTRNVVRGEWPRDRAMGRELMGRRFGLVGFGLIAQEVAKRARALGMDVAAHDPYIPEEDETWESAQRCDLDEIMSGCDVVSIHVPLSEATAGLIDRRLIESMLERAVLINTSRGGIVDESAVVDALRNNRLAGAALDVFASEPVDADYGSRFAEAPNLILTPHIAGITEESQGRIGAMTVAAVRRALGS